MPLDFMKLAVNFPNNTEDVPGNDKKHRGKVN